MDLVEHPVSTLGSGSRRGRSAREIAGRAGGVAIVLGGAALLGGCQVDSFLDPSIIGRWEATPTSLPILDRISVIEDDMGDMVETSDVLPEDLIPDAKDYRISPGDRLLITLYDLEDRQPGGTEFPRDVDLQGNIDLPQLGLIHVAGKTVPEAVAEVVTALKRFVIDPLVSIVPGAQRRQTFAVVGSVETPGPYFIPRPDYRLLEALTASGRFPESTEEVFIIRQIALDESVISGNKPSPTGEQAPTEQTTGTPPAGQARPADKKPAENLVDLIDELAKPTDKPKDTPKSEAPAETPKPAPEAPSPAPKQEAPKDNGSNPDRPAVEPKGSSASVLGSPAGTRHRQPADRKPEHEKAEPGKSQPEPAIDLPGQPAAPSKAEGKGAAPGGPNQEAVIELPQQPAEGQAPAVDLGAGAAEPTWVFVNGEWVMVKDRRAGAGAAAKPGAKPAEGGAPQAGADAGPAGQLVTQRVIRVPIKPLLAGDSRYNIVVRPGDTIRVPAALAGLVYITGQVQRPGPYSLPEVGKLTLLRAIDSAGSLSAIAIPERCDITRIVGKDRQATIRLNLRAIAEQTEPDLYLKPDDRINIGTNFWALPLAILRGGFRTNYGFGFVVDRNFGNDIFGPPPENRSF